MRVRTTPICPAEYYCPWKGAWLYQELSAVKRKCQGKGRRSQRHCDGTMFVISVNAIYRSVSGMAGRGRVRRLGMIWFLRLFHPISLHCST